MPNEEFMSERRRGLEESFFAKKNAELLANLNQNLTVPEQKEALAAASGISDDSVLDHLLNANIQAQTIAALGIVPLLAVAWADGELDDREKQAVLSACEAEGITTESPCYALLESWLHQPPSQVLLTAWKDFITAAKTKLSSEALGALKEDVLGRARKIAETSGGLLGIRAVSAEENQVLQDLQRAFG